MDYKKTLNLPDTKFPMKAELTRKEPEMLKFWDKIDVYKLMKSASGSKGSFVLHDGPPYANGHIHLGTALNKVLKDIIIKSRNLLGYESSYIPGWDCHGLPIELKVEQELGEKKKTLPAQTVRKICRTYAQKYLDIQRKEFIRLGVFGEWDNPYMTMAPEFEASTARELANFVESGSVVRSKKPIHWCPSCKTALAEAEVEYADHSSDSIYVRFPLSDKNLSSKVSKADPSKCFVVIWTTTPWTLPSNMAVAAHPNFEYALVEVGAEQYIIANELLPSCAKIFGWADYKVLELVNGTVLEGLEARHPFYDRVSKLILGEHVTLDSGTGLVHTAPGHGREDYEVALKYGIEVYSPLNDEAKYLQDVEFFGGMSIYEANPKVLEKLEELGNLLAKSKISHSYPHCWRCKKPVIFRATTQWFIAMDKNNLRSKALKAITDDVNWIPAWGKERIFNMIEFRPDWCISRQRTWGVPIIALICEECGHAYANADFMRKIADKIALHPTGCDYWYETDLSEIIPQGLTCPDCQGKKFRKETDILDVWFDSGSSFAAVVEKRDNLSFPADLYLEGSDQHRGWFHSSLLISVGTRGLAPYKNVLTHGYVVDSQGSKMSKSLGNTLAPQAIIDKYGAELLRLWISSVDYREDIRISDEILNRLVDAYRRIRNTARYLLGNIKDFQLSEVMAFEKLNPLDQYALYLASQTHLQIQKAYEEYEFHKVFHLVHKFCVTELSSFYLDILKDRLYSSATKSEDRLSAQTGLYGVLCILIRDIAPILSFTAEEIFSYIPESLKPDLPSVFVMPEPQLYEISPSEIANWELVLAVRSEITKAIEPYRKDGQLGHALDARITLYVNAKTKKILESYDLRSICIVSQLILDDFANADSSLPSLEIEDLKIQVEKARGAKCERCWIYSEELGTDLDHPNICPSCAKVMQSEEYQALEIK